jgi:agmatinase
MLNFPTRAPYTFLGLQNDFKKAKAVVLPVPYDSTTSYRSGTRDGPHAIIVASRQVELYDIELKKSIGLDDVYTTDELEPSMAGPEQTIRRVESAVSEIAKNSKFPLMFGGEHSITLGAARALKKHYKDLCVLQLDAHADLRDEYEDTKYNHACVMRRVREVACAVQAGIRNISSEEIAYVKKENVKNIFFENDFDIDKIVSALGKNVYISIDLDCLDPSIMPAVGTPEPNGLSWEQVNRMLKEVFAKKNVVGADIVELAPITGNSAPDFLAAKLGLGILMRKFYQNTR